MNNLSGILLAIVIGLGLICYAMFHSIQNKNVEIAKLEISNASLNDENERLGKVDKSNQSIISDLFTEIDETSDKFKSLKEQFENKKCETRYKYVTKKDGTDGTTSASIDFSEHNRLLHAAACEANSDC